MLCFVIAACAEDREAPPEPTTTRVIVGVRTTGLDRPQIVASQVGLQARMLAYAAEPVHAFQSVPYVVMRVDDDALARLRADPDVTSVREDRIVPPLLDSSTVVIHAPQAWAAGYTGAGQVIAVIDTGVRSDHVNLAGKVIAEACFSTTDPTFPSLSQCPGGVSQLIGPGAGCLPDALFAHGISALAGSWISDPAAFKQALATGAPWSHAARKFLLQRDGYPGLAELR